MRLTIRNSDGTVSQPMNLDWSAVLEKLAAYEDAEEQQSPLWIPVSERMPDHIDVLVVDGEFVGIASYQKRGDFWLGSDNFDDDPVAVTHWMPLPMPPKVGRVMKSPCLNCRDRSTSCHADCEKYADYRATIEKSKTQNVIQAYRAEMIHKSMTKKHK